MAATFERVLDIFEFARIGGEARGELTLAELPRMIAEKAADAPVMDGDPVFAWQIHGYVEPVAGSDVPRLMLDLEIDGSIWLNCQRCLSPYLQSLEVVRTLELVRTEAEADAAPLDDDEVDVIVGSREFDLLGLIEDELLLALPVSPRHDLCPLPTSAGVAAGVVAQAAEADAGAEPAKSGRPSPFAALSVLKGRTTGKD